MINRLSLVLNYFLLIFILVLNQKNIISLLEKKKKKDLRPMSFQSQGKVEVSNMESLATLWELTYLITDGELSEADGIIVELGSQFRSEGEL